MSFHDRVAVIEDDEEWLNIPPVLRKLLRHLNEENEHNRALTEALRQEQRDTNLLLRRLIQKQTDMELDFARSNLLLATKPHHSNTGDLDDGDDRARADVLLRKQITKTAERVKTLEGKIKNLAPQPAADTGIAGRLDAIEEQSKQQNNLHTEKIAQLESTIAANQSQLEAAVRQLSERSDQQKQHGDQQTALAVQVIDNVKTMEETCADIKAFVNGLDDELAERDEAFEKKHQIADRRFATVQCALEGIHDHLAEEKRITAEVQQNMREQSTEQTKTLLDKQRADVQKLVAASRQQTSDFERKFDRSRREQDDHLHNSALKYQEMAHKFDQQFIPDLAAVTRRHESFHKKITAVEDTVATLQDESVRRDRAAAALTDAAAVEKRASLEAVATLREQLQRLSAAVAESKQANGHEWSTMRGDMAAVQKSLQENSQDDDRVDAKVVRLSEVVHAMSGVVQMVEKRVDAVQQHQQLAPVPQPPKMEIPQPVEPLRRAVEDAAAMFREESTTSRDAQRALTSQQDATAMRVSQMERRLADLSLSIDYLKQKPTPPATLPAWAEKSLRELSPTLVEMEAIKRRITTVEATREESRTSKNSEVQRREELQLQVADSLEDTRRRVLELSRRLLAQEQQVASLSRSRGAARAFTSADSDDEDTHGGSNSAAPSTRSTLARLAHDVTEVLEKIFVTEQTLARVREDVGARVGELQKRVEICETNCDGRQIAAIVDVRVAEESRKNTDALDELGTRITAAADTAAAAAAAHEHNTKHIRNQKIDEQSATAAEQFRNVRESVSAQAAEVGRLSAAVAALEARGEAENRSDAPDRPSSAEVAEVRAHVYQHAELLQAQAATLRGIVEETIPHWQQRADRRMQELKGQLEQTQERCDEISSKPTATAAEAPSSAPEIADLLDHLGALTRRIAGVEVALSAQERDQQRRFMEAEEASEMAAAEIESRLGSFADRIRHLDTGAVAAPPPAAATANASHGAVDALRGELAALGRELREYAYPRAQLEERLENLWLSIVSLLARKADAEDLARRVEGLHELVREEAEARLRAVQVDVDAVLADKVGLQELQDMLENRALGDGNDDHQGNDKDDYRDHDSDDDDGF